MWPCLVQDPIQFVHIGRLIDVRTGHVTTNAYLRRNGDRIASVSRSAPHSGMAVLDFSRYTVVTGLIDSHVYILSNPDTQSSADYLQTSAPQATVRGVNNLQIWLRRGFTVVRDACEPYNSYPQFAFRQDLQEGLLEGPRIEGPRIVAAGRCVSLTGGHGDADSSRQTNPRSMRRPRPTPSTPLAASRGAT